MSAVANPAQALHKPTQAKSKYRPEIDGLRAFAVVAVIINHFNKDLLPSGYLGVDIFFVISGYVITSSLAGRESKNFWDFVTGFYERRIKRLVPALVVFVLITCGLICLFNPDPGIALRTGITSLFGFSNLYLFGQSTDYFAQSTELNPFTHTWSLGVEEQFYLLFPFLIWFSGFGQQTAKGARNLFFWVGAMSIASLLGFIYLYQVNQPAAYFLMPPRFWEMAAGCLLFIGFQKRARIEQALEQVPPLLIVAAIVGVMYLPVAAAVPATIGIVVLSAVLIACLKRGTVAYKFFTLEKVVYIGLISYSLYLWHWTVLSISRWTIGIHWWSVPIQAGLMLLMAAFSYQFIETPFRKVIWFHKRCNTLSIGTVFLLVVAGILVALSKSLSGRFYLGSQDLPNESKLNTGSACNIFDNLSAALKISSCGSDALAQAKTVYVLGDSHGYQYADWIAEEAMKSKINYKVIWGNSCLFPAAIIHLGGRKCFDGQASIQQKLIKVVKKGDIVIVANALYGHFYPKDGYLSPYSKSISREDALDEYSQAFISFSSTINALGAKVVFYTDGVRFPEVPDGALCQKEWFRPTLSETCFRSRVDHQNLIKERFPWINRWANTTNRFAWQASLFQSGCKDEVCTGGFYVDSNHYTKSEARLVLQRFLKSSRILASN